MSTPHPILRRFRAEQLVRLRRADEQERYVASQRQGRIDPNPHQIDAVIFALSRIPEGGCILADEVGLGKTIEAGLVIAQLLAEGSASRVLIIVPKPLLGQWQDELYRLFGIQAAEIDTTQGPVIEEGVFLVGRETAGGERGSSVLSHSGPFDLCVIDEAHEIFAGIHRRFDRHGLYRPRATEAQLADRVRSFLGQTPVLLLTATPIQNNLTELWSLVQYVEPTGTLLGNLKTFRDVFCDGDDRTLAPGQAHELKRRIETVVQRTLRRQAQEFLERPFVNRRARIFEYSMTAEEKTLYDDVTAYLLEPNILAFRGNQRRLLLIGFHRRMASSLPALAASLRKVADRLDKLAKGLAPESIPAGSMLEDLEESDLAVDQGESSSSLPLDVTLIEQELARVNGFVARAEGLRHDSKAEKLLEAMRVISQRPEKRQRVVIFTESLTTQSYLEEMLSTRGGFAPEQITLFRGTNDSLRAHEALERWQREVGDALLPHQRPSRNVAVRLALVHEFRTRSRVFISTEAGAKGLNLQFCDTLINYDLPWNPQRIEQRIGRCHRYSQDHDVTVINFLSADNEAQRLTFEILSRKLDLFGEVLDASDVVLHQPSTEAPEALAGAVGADFESQLRRIYDRARTVDEIESELRELRSQIEEQRKTFEQTWDRTAGLIETRFDEKVKDVFRHLRNTLPESLARFDAELDRLVTGFLDSQGVDYERTAEKGRIHFRFGPSSSLPEGLQEGGVVTVGKALEESAGPLHLGHPLVQAAVTEARSATANRLSVRWTLDDTAPAELAALKGEHGRLLLARIRYQGFEKVDRLLPVGVVSRSPAALSPQSLQWLFEHAPADSDERKLSADFDVLVEDALEEALFLEQAETANLEQERFRRHLEQVESYVEDQLLVLRRRISVTQAGLHAAEDKRDAALGSEARGRAETRVTNLQGELDKLESERQRLETRDDANYQQWREHAHQRRYHAPEIERILEAEFSLV